jgi:hypothetical protein
VIERQVWPARQPVVGPLGTKPASKLVTVKPKVSPASVVEKSWIAGGVFIPITKGMGPEAKVIGLPSVKYVAKVPPIAPATEEVPGANVRVRGGVAVKESVPLAEKKPLIGVAWAMAAELTVKAVKTTMRLSIRTLRRNRIRGKDPSHCSLSGCPVESLWLAGTKKNKLIIFM